MNHEACRFGFCFLHNSLFLIQKDNSNGNMQTNMFTTAKKETLLTPKKAIMYCDGGSRGNPGLAGAGAVLYEENGKKELGRKGVFCGRTTNNVAEYSGLIAGMELALENGVTDLLVRMDSKLAIEQMKGAWKVKNAGLKPLFEQAQVLASEFVSVQYEHVRREKNTVADAIANKVMDKHS